MSSPETCQAGKGHVTRPVAGEGREFQPRPSAFRALAVSLPWQGALKVTSAGPGTQAGRKARDRWASLPAGVDTASPLPTGRHSILFPIRRCAPSSGDCVRTGPGAFGSHTATPVALHTSRSLPGTEGPNVDPEVPSAGCRVPISNSHTHWHLVHGVICCPTPAFPSPPRLRARGAVSGERRLGGGSAVVFQFCAPSPCGRASVPSSCAHRECSVGGGRVPWVSTGLARPAPARPAPTAHGA